MNTLKQTMLSMISTGNVTLLRDSSNTSIVPKIYLSDAAFIQDPGNQDKWTNLDIGLVINATTDNLASTSLKNLYKQLGINYLEVPINDSNEIPPDNYFIQILQAVNQFQLISKNNPNNKQQNILVHCTAGINRSALVAAVLLWYTTPGRHYFWPSPTSLIEYMRRLQLLDRSLPLLINKTFENYLIKRLK